MVRRATNKQTSKSESESTRSVSPSDKHGLDQEETSSVDGGLKGSFSQHVSSMRGNGGQGIGLSKSRTEFAKGLQSTYGNSYTRQVVSGASDNNGPTIQTKLEVGASNDHYEMEADRIAEKIIGTTLPSNEGETSQSDASTASVQRVESTSTGSAVGAEGGQASTETDSAINSMKGNGKGLPADILESMEQKFGADFSQVNIHTGPQSSALNQDLSAKAFTTGNDVFFKDGEYSPETTEGQKVLAHELTHVLQQGDTGTDVQRWPKGKNPIKGMMNKLGLRNRGGEEEDVSDYSQVPEGEPEYAEIESPMAGRALPATPDENPYEYQNLQEIGGGNGADPIYDQIAPQAPEGEYVDPSELNPMVPPRTAPLVAPREGEYEVPVVGGGATGNPMAGRPLPATPPEYAEIEESEYAEIGPASEIEDDGGYDFPEWYPGLEGESENTYDQASPSTTYDLASPSPIYDQASPSPTSPGPKRLNRSEGIQHRINKGRFSKRR